MSKPLRPPPGRTAARKLCEPSPEDRQRIRNGLDRALARGSANPTVRRVEASMAHRALGVPERAGLWSSNAGLIKLLVPSLIVGTGLATLWSRAEDVTPPSAPVSLPLQIEDVSPTEWPVPPPLQPAAAGAPPWAAPVPTPAHKPAARAHPHHHASARKPLAPEPPPSAAEPSYEPPAAPAAASHHLAEELRLMRAASTALTDDEPGKALRILSDHARRFPDGALAQERRALRAIGLCKQRAPEARRERDAFLHSDAQSPLAARVRDACEPRP